MQEAKKPSRRPLICYYLAALLILMLLNMTFFPAVLEKPVQDVTYDQFMSMTYDKNVGQVEIEGDEITFTDKAAENIYRTTVTDDPGRTDRLFESGAQFQEIDTQPGLLTSILVGWVLPLLPFLLIGYFLNRRMKKAMGGDGMMFGMGGGSGFGGAGRGGGSFGGMGGGSNAKMYVPSSTGIRFADVAGEDEAKELLSEIVDFLHDPEKYRQIGAKLPKGALLVGPPGTGKTLLAKAVAGEANVPFFSIAGSEFVEMFVGRGAAKVRDLFKQANEKAPCIVFIDEIDTIGKKRDGQIGGNDEREQTLNQLLTEMDGFDGSKGVVVLAATNRPDSLDPALLRPGRFDRQIYVGLPDIKGREEILKVHAKGKPLAEDVSLRKLAQGTAGFTGADLENLLNEAALISARKNLPVITMQTMEDAVLKVIAGPEKRSLVNIERDRRITAIHEAGHAVAAYFLPTQEPVHQITIVPRGNALGLTISLPDQDTLHTTRNEMRDRIVVLLGGRVAEQLEFDDISTGASNDLQRATKLAHDMIAKYGMNERIGAVAYDDDSEIFVGRDYERTRSYSEQTAAEIDAEVRKTVDQAYAHCTQILTEHHEKLQEIAQWLLEHETMSRSQFEACMQALPIPEKQEGLLAGEEKTDGAEED